MVPVWCFSKTLGSSIGSLIVSSNIKSWAWPDRLVQSRFGTRHFVHNYRFMRLRVHTHIWCHPLVDLFTGLSVLTSPLQQPEQHNSLLPDLRLPGEADHNPSRPGSPYPFTAWERIPTLAHRDPFKALHMKSLPLQWYLTLHLHIHIFRVRSSLPVCTR